MPTVMFQWATGGLFFLWVTTRRREVGLGYGWLMRSTFALMIVITLLTANSANVPQVMVVGSSLTLIPTVVALVVSIQRKSGGVSGQVATAYERSKRVAVMTGIDRDVEVLAPAGPEFAPILDLFAPIIGLITLLITGFVADGSGFVLAYRLFVGSLFLGAVTDTMLLGHWYLVQPGLKRDALNELINYLGCIWPLEVLGLLLPVGMISALNGDISDGYSGLLTYFWLVCAITTIGLVFVTRLALKEKQYAAVMAATGLTYLAILTAFGTDLVARAILA